MNADRWREIDDLLVRALELDPADRPTFLLAQTDDAELRREVEALIEASEQPGAFLDRPALGGVAALLHAPVDDAASLIGRRLGPYRIESVIATGGMGAVFLGARDDDTFTMRVAIKLVRGGPGSSSGWAPETLRRFALERQVLAELEHPSIARLIDGGADADGRPFLVMEHVEGLPIDAHCDRARLGLPERVRLFVAVCRAVQHAHQRLIIHRDLKPSNILVTPDGRPKLLDFGLAKIMDPHRAALRSAQTSAGQFMGTLAFAAPEQVAGSAHDQDVRTDVYALGMILYALVAGEPAYSVDAPIGEVLERITRRVPAAPSSRSPRVSRELDAIVMKAIAKGRDARYQSAAELADDLERLLAGEPVRARGAGRWYVLRKAARRHRVALATASGVLAIVLLFAGTMAVQATRLRDRGEALEAALRASNIERARTLGASGSVVEAEDILWRELLASLPPGPDPDLARADRGAYWALWELATREPCRWTTDLPRERGPIVQLTRDGRRVVARNPGGRPCVIDARTGTVLWELPGAASEATAVTAPQDDGELWYTLPDGAVMRWRPGEDLPSPAGRSGLERPTGIRRAGDGWLLVCADGGAAIVDPNRPDRTVSLPVTGTRARDAAISPDGSLIALASDDGHVRLFDGAGRPLATLLEPERWVARVAFSPDGRYLAADVGGADVVVIDAAARAVVARMTDASGWINSLRFDPDRAGPARLLASSVDKSAYVWEVPSGRLVRRLAGHAAPLHDAAFADAGATVVTLGAGVVRAWDLDPEAWVTRWDEPDSVFGALFTPDGRRVVTSSGDRRNAVTVRDAASGAVERVLHGHTGAVTSLALTPDGAAAVTGSYDGSIRVWALTSPDEDAGRALGRPAGPAGVNSVDVSPDGRSVVAAFEDGSVRVISMADGTVEFAVDTPATRVPSVRFSPDGAWIVAATSGPAGAEASNAVLLVDRRSRAVRTLATHGQTVRIVRFCPDGELFASAGDDLAIRLWSMCPGRTGVLTHELAGHHTDVFALAFSPDGTLLASGGRDGTVRLWDVAEGRCLATFPAQPDMVFALAFSPDGRTLLSAGRGGSIALRRLDHFDAYLRGNRAHHESLARAARPARSPRIAGRGGG